MKRYLVILACAAIAGQTAFAAQVWSEDFEALTAATDNSGSSFTDIGFTGGGGSYRVRDDVTASPFGTGNQWAQLSAWGNPWVFVDKAEAQSSVSTISFDFYAATGVAPAAGDSYLRVAVSQTGGNAGLVDLGGGGNTVAISYDTVMHFDIVANVSGGTINNGIGGTVGDKFVDVYVDGSYAASIASPDSDLLDGFGLWMNDGPVNGAENPPESMYMDNLEYWESAHVIPEPATFGLLGMAALGMYAARKLRKI